MKRISMWKAVIAFAVALAFILPSAPAFANFGMVGVTSNSKNTVGINNNIGGTIMSDTPREDTILTEKTVAPAVPLTRGTVYVDDNALPEWYNATHVHTIQEGVTNATAGDTVYVYNGTYIEKVNVTKRLSLVGESRDNVIVNGSGTGNVFIITTPVTNVNISTFTITNGQYGIQIKTSSYNSITNCNAYKNTGAGIYVYTTSTNNSITNCNVYNNKLYGIYIAATSNNNIITNCNVYNNSGQFSGQGINIASSSKNKIMNCNVYNNNNYGIIIGNAASTNNSITSCNVYNQITYYGIYFQSSRYNNVTNCNVYNNKQHAFYFGTSSYNKFRDNTIYNNGGNFYFDGTTVAHFTHDIDPTNMLNGKRIFYLFGLSNQEYNETSAPNMGYLGLISCTNITVKNADVGGILVINTAFSTILNVDSHNGTNGIYLAIGSNNNTITNCDAYNNANYGIYLTSSSKYNTIMNCNVYNNRNYGISLASSSNNNNITNCNVNNTIMYYGIYLSSSSNNKITNCNAYNNKQYGIYIATSTNNSLSGNTIYNNGYNFGVDGTTVAHFTHVIDPLNTVNGKHIYYLLNVKNTTLDETNNIGYLGLISCKNITAKNADVNGILVINTTYSTILNVDSHNASTGIYLAIGSNNINIASCDVYNNMNYGIYISSLHLTAHNTIINCNAYNNTYHGIYLAQSKYNNITNCNAYNNKNHGIYLYGTSNYNNITNCNAYNNAQHGIYALGSGYNKIMNCNVYNQITYYGINIYGSANNNNITNCNVHNNNYGIYIYTTSNNNNVTNCNVYSNILYGIYLKSNSNGNWILHNNFVNNVNAYDICSNKWNDSYPSGGNYWSNYTGVDNYHGPGQNISGSDGIGDTPYNISGGSNKDRYPLMNPRDVIPPVITAVQATPALQNITTPVNITCTVTDNWNLVDTVEINITGPGEFTLEATMNEGSNYYYEDTYSTIGVYFYYIRASDTSGNIAVSDTYSFVIRTELETPTSAVNPLPIWKKVVPFAVTATAYDNTGVANVTLWSRYSTNGTSWTAWTSYGIDEDAPWSWSFTGVDGYYQFYSIAVDTQSNVEEPPSSADASTGIDTVKPVTTVLLTGTMGGNNWYTSIVTVALSATDTLSGIESRWYKVDAGYWSLYSAPFTVSGEGQHTVSYYSFDQAGNQEAANSVSFKIDTATPTTTHTLDGIIGSQGWYITNVTVTLSANDVLSGVNYTKYKLNDGSWIVYTGSFVVTTDGNNTLYYFSVDLAGNTETIKQVVFKIQHDILPPVTTHVFVGTSGENGWFVSPAVVSLTAVDDSSGVAFTMYKLDDDVEWHNYTGSFSVTEDGEHTIAYYSVDRVGNEETPFNAELKIDKTKPSIDLTATAQNLLKNRWLLVANVSDDTSGVARVEFYVASALVGNVTTAPYEFLYEGTDNPAQAVVYDIAGNSEVSNEAAVTAYEVNGQQQSIPLAQMFMLLKNI